MLENVPAAIGHALRAIRPGLEKIAFSRNELAAPATLRLESDAFGHDQPIPARFTADGARVSPPLRFRSVPAAARSLALIVEDADSPTPAPLCHVLAWAISPKDGGGLQEAALDGDAMPTARSGAQVGRNSFMASGWLPPDPPTGHGLHRYAFQLYALDEDPDLEAGAGRSALIDAMKGHVIAKGLLIGTYERAG